MNLRGIRNGLCTPRGVAVVILALVVAITIGVTIYHFNFVSDHNSTAPADSPPPPSTSAKETPEEIQRRYDHEEAVATKDSFPWHYKCRTYPPTAELLRKDLIPTANVIVVIAFNATTGKYEVQGADPRVTVYPRQDFLNKANSDVDHPFVTSLFTWTYAKGLRHYGVFKYERNTDAQGKSYRQPEWYQMGGTYNPTISRYQAVTFDDGGEYEPLYMVVATDPRSCAHGTTPLPTEFRWEQYAEHGYMRPDYEDPAQRAATYGPGENPKHAN